MVKFYTAWELAESLWWVDKYLAYMPNGRKGYETATVTRTEKSVRLSRIVAGSTAIPIWTIEQKDCYVAPETMMILTKINQ